MKGILVTGTDTDVGKTWFMLKFGSLLKEKNRNFHFLKPVESGCIEPDGSIIPKDATKFSKLENKSLNTICEFMFKAYASPPKAAKMENRTISLEQIVKFIKENKDDKNDCINIVEGCGGFYSPIANNKLTADLASELRLPVMLVVKNALGCINHTLLTIQSIKERKLDLRLIILNNISKETPLDNFEELSQFTDIPIVKLGYNEKLNSEVLKYLD
tara:strand:- start:216 stop:863 length:648 start_codon:yes stop_codon:yes gene_type:complete